MSYTNAQLIRLCIELAHQASYRIPRRASRAPTKFNFSRAQGTWWIGMKHGAHATIPNLDSLPRGMLTFGQSRLYCSRW